MEHLLQDALPLTVAYGSDTLPVIANHPVKVSPADLDRRIVVEYPHPVRTCTTPTGPGYCTATDDAVPVRLCATLDVVIYDQN